VRALALVLLLALPAAAASGDPTFDAMSREMARSMTRLKQDEFGAPYFMAYRVIDERYWEAAASYGSMISEGEDHSRSLFVEARYGSRTLDNTDLGFQGWHGPGGFDPKVLREHLWLLTDGAYKNAVSSFLEKKARRATEFVPEALDDFTLEKPAVAERPSGSDAFDYARGRALAERLSAVFQRYPEVYDSRVVVQLRWARRYLLTSEGTRLDTPAEEVPDMVRVAAMTRAEDGMRIDNHHAWTVRSLADLPPDDVLLRETEQVARELSDERQAPVQAPIAAPAILDQEFTGVLFHEALGHKLEGQRQRDPQQSQVFRDLVGKRIIPADISLLDDPTMTDFKGEPLHGAYEFDSEGVPASRVVLVDHGVLENFLMSRWPVHGFSSSNGHGRADSQARPTGRMANLVVRADAPVPRAELTRKLVALARKAGKPYGFLLVGAFGGENPNSRDAAQTLEVRPRLVYRVDAKTGAQTLVRGVTMVGTPLVVLNRIVAAADDASLANGFHCGAESGWVPVDQIAPSVLVSEIELQRQPEDRARPPILPSPFHESGK